MVASTFTGKPGSGMPCDPSALVINNNINVAFPFRRWALQNDQFEILVQSEILHYLTD